MSEKRVVVPEGMRDAFEVGYDHQKGLGGNRDACERGALEAALLWLSENPQPIKRFDFIAYDGEQGMEEAVDGDYVLYADVCRMFLAPDDPIAYQDGTLVFREGTDVVVGVYYKGRVITTNMPPEPEVPEEVKDLWELAPMGGSAQKAIIEAFNRGKKAGK